MSLDSILGLINVGAVGVMLGLFVLGFIYPRSVVTDLKAEIVELKGAVNAERDRADAAIAAAQASKDVISAFRSGLQLSGHDLGTGP